MLKTWCFTRSNRHRTGKRCQFGAMLLSLLIGSVAFASTPDWLKQAAQTSVPEYSDAPDAVVLLDERLTTVAPTGEVRITFRKAYKILRPGGSNKGIVRVYFDNETQLTFLKAWSITAKNEEYEVKERDAIETAAFSESLYADTHYKVLQIPAAEPGSIIGYEYQQRQRKFVLQTLWLFQDELPVRRARFTLELPSGWQYSAAWRNHAAINPRHAGENRWTWELTDIEAVSVEPEMPTWRSVAGFLGLSFAQNGSAPGNQSLSSWQHIGRWYAQLTNGTRESTPAIRDQTRAIVADAKDPLERISRLAGYVQHGIRYVAIEIGIGGYKPHAAQDVLASGYGDCKDKVTLLSTMLREVGIDSYYVLMNTDRDYVSADFPTPLDFDHVILAIRLPNDTVVPEKYPILANEKLGRLLLFDPTDNFTPLGYLPSSLQSNYGLLVSDVQGELVKVPLMHPSANHLSRMGTIALDSMGNLNGTIEELRTGPYATEIRRRLMGVTKKQFQKVFQDMLADLIDGALLTSAGMSDLGDNSDIFSLKYQFTAPAYAQRIGGLLFFRPCVLGRKESDLLEDKPRKQPVEFAYAASESEIVKITLPSEYVLEEMPQSVKYDYGFASYKSQTKIAEHTLQYNRVYEIRDVKIPLNRVNDLKKLYRQIAQDERAYTILHAR
jgi:hypothetical protein